jgi:hypothetical protein
LTTLNALGLDDSVRCTAERLRPWQQFEAAEKSPAHPERVPFSAGQIASGVASTRDFIANRPGELASFFGVPAPAQPPSQPCPPPTQRPGHEAPLAIGPPAVSPVSLPSLSVSRSRVRGRAVHLQVMAPAAGDVVLYGWIGAGKKHANACAPARLGVTAAGPADITCKLTESVRRRRAKHWLRLHLKLDFVPSSGAPQEIRSDFTLSRR